MLLLSSGRVIDISTARAKYHALKLQGPSPNAKHRSLYGLVDVLYRFSDNNGIARRGWTEYDYKYSGFTLGNLHQASDLSEIEKSELLQWVSKASQRNIIETARRRLIENQTLLSVKHNTSPTFLYSALRHHLLHTKMQRATTSHWQATINNMQQAGIRLEEIIWSGLNDFLAAKDANEILRKDEILAAVNFKHCRLELTNETIKSINGGLNFKEVAQRMAHQAVYRATLKLDNSCQCILRYIDKNYNYRVGVIKTLSYEHFMAMNKYWFALDPYGRAILNKRNNSTYYTTSEEAKKAANTNAKDITDKKSLSRFNTQYDHLTLFGGDNYREWIVSLPDYPRTFYGAHYFDHNILLHIRTTTRHDNHANKLLFIEEVQSDWHQNGHTQGYDNSCWGKIANAPFKKEWVSLAMKLMLIRANNNGFDGIAWPDGDIQETRYSKNLSTIKRRYDVEIPQALNKLGKDVNCYVERTTIKTRDPWLNLVRSKNKWRVSDNHGKFKTRDKYHSREEAMGVLHRHCKCIQLGVNLFLLNKSMRRQITETGLPLFGAC